MKNKFILVCVLCACASVIYAQDTIEVPNLARLSLYKEFPRVAKTQWTKESETVYRAEFSIYRDKNRYMAKYDTKGNLIEKSIGIPYWQIPNEAKAELVKRFQNFTLVSSSRFEVPNQKPVFHVTIERVLPDNAVKETYSIDISYKGELLKVSEQETTTAKAE